jgi:hypothetical protein
MLPFHLARGFRYCRHHCTVNATLGGSSSFLAPFTDQRTSVGICTVPCNDIARRAGMYGAIYGPTLLTQLGSRHSGLHPGGFSSRTCDLDPLGASGGRPLAFPAAVLETGHTTGPMAGLGWRVRLDVRTTVHADLVFRLSCRPCCVIFDSYRALLAAIRSPTTLESHHNATLQSV